MLLFAFFLSFIALILRMTFLPLFVILPFAPFLAISNVRCNLKKALSLAVLAGGVMDLFSNDPMGLHALNYALTCFLLFSVKKHFIEENPFHLSLYTALISSISTLLQLALLFLFDRRVPFNGIWGLLDLIGMPAIDGLYAFVWFAGPLLLFEKLKKTWVVFWLKRKKLSRT